MTLRRCILSLVVCFSFASAPASHAATPTSVTVNWTTPGDDGLSGTASQFDLRYSTSPITSTNWGSATAVSGLPSPASSGTAQGYVVKNLSREVTYYFAMRTTDDAGNTSALSNVPSVTTPDTTPPATVQNLSVNFVW